jgi:hypothetical protein
VPDLVAIEGRGKRSCRYRLAVWTKRGLFAAPLHFPNCPFPPYVAVLAAIDRDLGLEIVIRAGTGGETELAGIWKVGGSNIAQLRLPDSTEGLLTFSEGPGHSSRLDCVSSEPGVVVWSLFHRERPPSKGEAAPYEVTRTFYRAAGGNLVFVRVERLDFERGSALIRVPEWREPQPFPSCSRAPEPEPFRTSAGGEPLPTRGAWPRARRGGLPRAPS